MCETKHVSVACEWELSDMFKQIWLHKSHKFLHMEDLPRPSPQSAKNTVEKNIRYVDKMLSKLGLQI